MYFFVAQLSMAFARLTFQGGFFGLIPASGGDLFRVVSLVLISIYIPFLFIYIIRQRKSWLV